MLEQTTINITNKHYINALLSTQPKASEWLVFLHDALGSIPQWKGFPQTVNTDNRFNLLVYERQGHGQSSPLSAAKPSNYFDLETAELNKVLNALDIVKPILIGSSDGATIALQYAAQYPTTAVVSMAGHYFVEPCTRQGVADAVSGENGQKLIKALQKYHPNPKLLVQSWQQNWTSDDFFSWNIKHQLPQIDCPCLIVQGKKDQYATDFHALSMAQIIGRCAEVQMLEDTGHFPHLECPETMKNMIQSFLTTTLKANL